MKGKELGRCHAALLSSADRDDRGVLFMLWPPDEPLPAPAPGLGIPDRGRLRQQGWVAGLQLACIKDYRREMHTRWLHAISDKGVDS